MCTCIKDMKEFSMAVDIQTNPFYQRHVADYRHKRERKTFKKEKNKKMAKNIRIKKMAKYIKRKSVRGWREGGPVMQCHRLAKVLAVTPYNIMLLNN